MITIIVKTTFSGEHYWKQAPKEVEFLRMLHPHIFFVEAEIEVYESDRELEFFIVKRFIDRFINLNFANRHFSLSCEQIARQILEAIERKYGDKRKYRVAVYEDNNNGGRFYKRWF